MSSADHIELLLADFFRAFDQHDWTMLRNTLADDLKIDFATPRGGSPKLVKVMPGTFVRQREYSCSHLRLHHEFNLTDLTIRDKYATAGGSFRIKRFSIDGERHFHSWGEYQFEFVELPRKGWRIGSIAQMTWRSEGDYKLHSPSRERLTA